MVTARWRGLGKPAPLVSVAGTYSSVPPGTSGRQMVSSFAVDETGQLWGRNITARGDSFLDGSVSTDGWQLQGTPGRGVAVRDAVGAMSARVDGGVHGWTFVVGDDGHLWALTAVGTTATWVDHGSPGARVLMAGPPIPPESAPGPPVIHAIAEDGRLWMRSMGASGWRWSDRGSPQGVLIFSLVGAAGAPLEAGRRLHAVVIGSDGHFWLSSPQGDGFGWTDLGGPTAEERIVTGIGFRVGKSPDNQPLLIIVGVGSPSGQVWCHRRGDGMAPQWTTLGLPNDADPLGIIGIQPDRFPSHCMVNVIGHDQRVWSRSTGRSMAWTGWFPRADSSPVVGGVLSGAVSPVFLSGLLCVMVLSKQHECWLLGMSPIATA